MATFPALSLTDFDTPANGANALDDALTAAATAGGGEIIVPPNASPWNIDAAVTQNFGTAPKASYLRLKGYGSSSQLMIDVGSGVDGITIQGLDQGGGGMLVIEGITFITSDPTANADARAVLKLSHCGRVIFKDCVFYGLAAHGGGPTDGGVVFVTDSDLWMSDCQFLGCTADSGSGMSIVQGELYGNVVINRFRAQDYGELNGVYYSKTPSWSANADIAMGSPNEDFGRVVIRDMFSDEGKSWAVYVVANGGVRRLKNLHVEGVRGNVGLGGVVRASQVEYVRLHDTYYSQYAPATQHDLINATSCDYVELSGVKGVPANVGQITVDDANRLTVHDDCVYETLALTNVDDARISPEIAVPAVVKTANHTLALPDAGRVIEVNSGSARVITIPADATVDFTDGTIVELYRVGDGEVTVAPDVGVTLSSPTNKTRLRDVNSTAMLRKRSTNEWVLSGDIK